MSKILVVDDHAVVRSGIRQFLLDAKDDFEIFEAANGTEALELITSQSWDVVLLDIGLNDIDGIEVLRRIKTIKPELKVLIFSMFDEDEYAILAIETGAAGYLSKDSDPNEILHAIKQVAQGRRYLSDKLTNKLLSGREPNVRSSSLEPLSKRELEVMLLISSGMSLVKIGDQLHLSSKTITTFRARILRKLGLMSNADITRYVIEHRLGAAAPNK